MPSGCLTCATCTLLDLVSHGRRGPGGSSGLSPGQIEQIARTVLERRKYGKVLPKDSNNAGRFSTHRLHRSSRRLGSRTDDGSQFQGRGVGQDLFCDWDLDLETHQRESEFARTRGRPAPKLVHKLMFSMSPGTTQGVLAAVRNLAMRGFALSIAMLWPCIPTNLIPTCMWS